MIGKNDKVFGKSFVVISGDTSFLNSVERVLLFAGANIYLCKTEEKGVIAAANYSPHAIIIYDSFPSLNIPRIVKDLQIDPATKNIPLIIITSEVNWETVKPAITSSPSPHLYISDQDFDLLKLVVRIEEVLKNSKDSGLREHSIEITGKKSQLGEKEVGEGLKILIIEDDFLLRDLLAAKLKQEKINHNFCHSGEGAVAVIESYRPSVIILDYILPGKTGIEVLSEMRQSPSVAKTPVIIFSNKDSEEYKQKAVKLGVKYFLTKVTTDLNDLIALVVKLAKKS
jgi:DNA-binding response OmpR family regulator